MLLSPHLMHIPDGFLSILVSTVLWILSIFIVGYALRRVSADMDERKLPLMGVVAAAIFAGQMLNFAVTGGTSGHLMGAALATILLGPWAAMLVMTIVVSVQAVLFQDGGLIALGANIFNMGVVGVTVSYMAYQVMTKLTRGQKWSLLASGFAAAWLSIEITALGVALQLALSGTSPANLAIPTMGAIHAIIGIGEGLITVGALAFIYASRRDLIENGTKAPVGGRLVWVAGLLIALALAVASPWASAYPDGLEWVAKQKGFLNAAQGPLYQVIPNYVLPGIHNEAVATIAAGILGTLIVFGVAVGVAYSRRKAATAALEPGANT
jgi:cobalt/nickel transport system permease protein